MTTAPRRMEAPTLFLHVEDEFITVDIPGYLRALIIMEFEIDSFPFDHGRTSNQSENENKY